MKKWVLVLFLFPITLLARVNGNGDFQIWNETSFHFQLDPRVTSKLSVEFRWGDHAKTLFYKHIQHKLACEVNPYLTLRPSYRMIWLREGNKWVIIYQPFFEFLLHLLVTPHVRIFNRNRITYSIVPNELGGGNSFGYRNRTRFIIPLTLGNYQFEIFVGDEVFFREGRGFSQNRAMAGFILPRGERAHFELFYVYRNLKNRSHDWTYQNVLRLSANFFF